MRTLLNTVLISLVRLYRWMLSPMKYALFGPLGRCRFEPSCSAYALEALQRHGPFHGTRLAVRRVCRCNPWGGCGHDPVPPARGARPEGKDHAMNSRRAALTPVPR